MSDLDELDAAIAAAERALEETLEATRRARDELAGERLEVLAKQLERTQAEALALELANDVVDGELLDLAQQAAELERRIRLT